MAKKVYLSYILNKEINLIIQIFFKFQKKHQKLFINQYLFFFM